MKYGSEKEGKKRNKARILEYSRHEEQGEDAWKYLEGFDILDLTETWIEKDWEKMRKKLPNKFRWECIPAAKEKKKGRVE